MNFLNRTLQGIKYRMLAYLATFTFIVCFHFQMTMLVYVPADAVVGEYRMAVNFFYLNKEKVEEKKVLPVDDPIIVLFNPFSQGNLTHLFAMTVYSVLVLFQYFLMEIVLVLCDMYDWKNYSSNGINFLRPINKLLVSWLVMESTNIPTFVDLSTHRLHLIMLS